MSATEHRAVPARVDPRFKGGMAATATIDVRGLRRRLEADDHRGGALRHPVKGAVRHRRLELPAGPDRRRRTEDAGRCRRHPPRLSRVRRADRQPRRRDQPVRRDGQLRRWSSTTPSTSRRSATPTPRHGTVICQPGAINEHVNEKTGRQVEHGLRARSVHPLALRDRREHREQLVRDPLRAGAAVRPRAAHLRQRRSDGDRHPRRRPLLGGGGRGGPARSRSSPRAGARARSTPGCVTCATAMPSSSVSATSQSTACPAASRATTSTSCSRSAASMWRARWSAPSRPARRRSRSS